MAREIDLPPVGEYVGAFVVISDPIKGDYGQRMVRLKCRTCGNETWNKFHTRPGDCGICKLYVKVGYRSGQLEVIRPQYVEDGTQSCDCKCVKCEFEVTVCVTDLARKKCPLCPKCSRRN